MSKTVSLCVLESENASMGVRVGGCAWVNVCVRVYLRARLLAREKEREND